MTDDLSRVICIRCGEKVFKRSINIKNLHKYDLSSKTAYINSLMKYEDISREVATSWAEHGLYDFCKEKEANCPVCSNKLKTWHSKLCLKCGAKIEVELEG